MERMKLFFFVARVVVILVYIYIYMLNAARRLNGFSRAFGGSCRFEELNVAVRKKKGAFQSPH